MGYRYDYYSNAIRLGLGLQGISEVPGFHFEMVEGTMIERCEKGTARYTPIGDMITVVAFDGSNKIIGAMTNNPNLKDAEVEATLGRKRSLVADIVDLVSNKVNRVSRRATLIFNGNGKKLSVNIGGVVTYSAEGAGGAAIVEDRNLIPDLISSCDILYSLQWDSDFSVGGHRAVTVSGSQIDVYKELTNLLYSNIVLACKDNRGATVEIYLSPQERFAVIHDSRGSRITNVHGMQIDALVPHSIYITNIKKQALRERYRDTY